MLVPCGRSTREGVPAWARASHLRPGPKTVSWASCFWAVTGSWADYLFFLPMTDWTELRKRSSSSSRQPPPYHGLCLGDREKRTDNNNLDHKTLSSKKSQEKQGLYFHIPNSSIFSASLSHVDQVQVAKTIRTKRDAMNQVKTLRNTFLHVKSNKFQDQTNYRCT